MLAFEVGKRESNMVLRRLKIMSAVRFGGVAGVMLGLCMGVFLLGASLLRRDVSGFRGVIAMVVMLPAVYGIAGALLGLGGAFTFNVAARVAGGLHIDATLGDAEDKSPS